MPPRLLPHPQLGQRPIPIWPLLAAAVAFRLWYASFRQLVPDEAFYWAMSRHLQRGYLDHPPMLMALIRASTWLLGSTEVGVRFVAISLGFGLLLVLLRLARDLLDDNRAPLFLLLMWLASPLFHGLAGIVTPDTPAIFFSLCGLGRALAISRRIEQFGRRQRDAESSPDTLGPWLGLGFFSGLAMLSKYTTVLLPGSIVFALLTHPRGRREFLRPGPYLSAILALVIFSPVIQWNATHGWASFAYQLNHGLAVHPATQPVSAWASFVKHGSDFAEYIGLQILFFTPVLFILGTIVLITYWKRFNELAMSRRMVLWAATLPLVLFALAATRSKGEGNWPAFGYFPASLLMAEYLLQRQWKGAAMKWAKIGCAVALAISIVMHAPELLYYSHILRPLNRKLVDTYGWREMGQAVATARGSKTFRGMPVVCNTHEDAGELAFYTPGQPDVWCVRLGSNSRPTAFDYLPGGPQLDTARAVLLIGGNRAEFCQRYGLRLDSTQSWVRLIFGHRRDRTMDVCVRDGTK